MRNKIKSISLALGALAAVATPTVAVISCGTKAKTHHRPLAFVPKGKDNKETVENVNVNADYKEHNTDANMSGDGITTDYDKVSKDGADATQTFANFQDYRNDSKGSIAKLKKTLLNDATANPVDVTRAIVERYIGDRVDDFTFNLIAKKSVPTKYAISKNRSTVMENKEFNEYTIEVTADHQVIIEGSSAVAMARGWYDWMKRNGYGMIGWQSNSIHLPTKEHFKVTAKFKTSSPYERHYFGNSAAAGYSSPWWNGDNWANWLAWCAVHGYDLMLDYVGHEQILTKLFLEVGFSEDNIREYLSGPAYATWSRLGNIANWDSIPDHDTFKAWSDKRVVVQKEIKAMMDKMDIKGIPASFAGFVPEVQNGVTESFESKFGAPEPDYEHLPNGQTNPDGTTTNKDHTSTHTQRTHWTRENQHHNHFLNPDWQPTGNHAFMTAMETAKTKGKSTGYDRSVSLFQNMSKRYVELYQQEFGEFDFYLADAFEEMYIPPSYDKPAYFKKVGNALYGGIEAATINNTNGSAVFAFQGWNLGFQRADWNADSLQGFLEDIPDNKVFIIDQAEDYNEWSWHNNANFKHFKKDGWSGGESFGGKKWVYSTIPNMGGNTAITGNLEWYGTAGPDALADSKHGYLFAYGSAPEGIDTNPVTQELIADMGWRRTSIDIKNGTLEGYVGNNWLANYDINRYGFESKKLREYWLRRLATANSYLDDHPIHKWQLAGWETWSAPDSDGWLMAIQSFKEAAVARKDLKNTPLFRDDLFRMTNIYLGVILDRKLTAFQGTSDIEAKKKLKTEIDAIFDKMNRLTATHNTDRLSRWLEMARWWGDTDKQRNYFEQDAKYHLTLWYPSLEDYASKHWGGLIGYYKKKMDALMDRDITGQPLSSQEQSVTMDPEWITEEVSLPRVSLPWIYNPLTGTDLQPAALDHPYQEAIDAMNKYSVVHQSGITPDSYATLMSNTAHDDLVDVTTTFQVTTEQLQNLKSLTIFSKVVANAAGKVGDPTIKDISIVAGGEIIWKHRNVLQPLDNQLGNADALTLNLQGLPSQVASNSNNGAQVVITWSATVYTDAKLQLFMNADIDQNDDDKKINGAKTYSTLWGGRVLRNEVQFNGVLPTPRTELPQTVLPEHMNVFIKNDGTVNKSQASRYHASITPINVESKGSSEATITYKVTADTGYELAATKDITLLDGSYTEGTFTVDKTFTGTIPTVEQLTQSILHIFEASFAQNTFTIKDNAMIPTHDDQINDIHAVMGQFNGLEEVYNQFAQASFDGSEGYAQVTLEPKQGDDTKWILKITLFTTFDNFIDSVEIEMPKPAHARETVVTGSQTNTDTSTNAQVSKTPLETLIESMHLDSVTDNQAHDFKAIAEAIINGLHIDPSINIPAEGLEPIPAEIDESNEGDDAEAKAEADALNAFMAQIPGLSNIHQNAQCKQSFKIVPDTHDSTKCFIEVTLTDEHAGADAIAEVKRRISMPRIDTLHLTGLADSMKHDLQSVEAAIIAGELHMDPSIDIPAEGLEPIPAEVGESESLTEEQQEAAETKAQADALNAFMAQMPGLSNIHKNAQCGLSFKIVPDTHDSTKVTLQIKLTVLDQDGNPTQDVLTRTFSIPKSVATPAAQAVDLHLTGLDDALKHDIQELWTASATMHIDPSIDIPAEGLEPMPAEVEESESLTEEQQEAAETKAQADALNAFMALIPGLSNVYQNAQCKHEYKIVPDAHDSTKCVLEVTFTVLDEDGNPTMNFTTRKFSISIRA